ncbi:MAG: VCBS repeat-containing protein [Planctomycetales bacterium]|nr:VCBS repeat-containing protein [Planctomycetales bacterium]
MSRRTAYLHRLRAEALEPRYCLTLISVVQHDVANSVASPLTRLADLDSDGDLDVVAVTGGFLRFGPNASVPYLAWHENLDGKGTFGIANSIGQINASSIRTVDPKLLSVTDIDGDGDNDIIIGNKNFDRFDSFVHNRGLEVYVNANGLGTFEKRDLNLKSAGFHLADVDGDADLDIVSVVDPSIDAQFVPKEVVWYENTGALTFADAKTIYQNVDPFSVLNVHSADVDGDSDLDMVVAGDGQVSWLANTNGLGDFGAPHSFAVTSVTDRGALNSGDMDGDGDLDLIVSPFRPIKVDWYPNLDGLGTFGDPIPVAAEGVAVSTIEISVNDVDRDGDLDVYTVSHLDTKIAWYENSNGLGEFGSQQLLGETLFNIGSPADLRTIDIGDIDADGFDDFVFYHEKESRMVWMRNDGQGNFEDHTIAIRLSNARSAFTADMDEDGDLDIVFAANVAGEEVIGWYENLDGLGQPGTLRIIANTAVEAIAGGDIDGDGDIDVLATRPTQKKIEWFQNEDGKGTFGAAKAVADKKATSISATDIDGDGDLDVLAGNRYDLTLSWLENNGTGIFDTKEEITACEDGVFPVDIDNDSDLDVVAWGPLSAWYENLDGFGDFGDAHIISENHPRKVSAADMDGDGDQDFLVHESFRLQWQENVGGGVFEQHDPFVTGDLSRNDHYVGDMDADGDVDVVMTSGVQRKILYYENASGDGTAFTKHVLAENMPGIKPTLFVSDIDGDQDLDLLVTFDNGLRVAWFENRAAADSNNDGVFDSGDLVAAFSAGEYEDGVPNNSTFDEGDWNGDGDFDSADIVFAFKHATYRADATGRSSEIAAAIDFLFASSQTSDRRGDKSLT